MSDRPDCKKCGEPATGIYEGIRPPSRTVRFAACDDCIQDDMTPVETLVADGGVSVGTYDDLHTDRDQPVDRNPRLPCRLCGDTYDWQDYWKDRILGQDCDPRNAVYWCADCAAEVETVRKRLANNQRLTDFTPTTPDHE